MSDSPERWSDEWIDQLWLDTISLRGPLRTGEMRDFARAVAREAMEEAASICEMADPTSSSPRRIRARAKEICDGR